MSECVITATLRDRQGAIAANTRVIFDPKDGVVGQYGSVLLPLKAEATSDEAGAISVSLRPGKYIGRWKSADASETFEFSVPEAASAVLSDLIPGSDIDVSPQALLDAQSARDDAQAAAATATTKAGEASDSADASAASAATATTKAGEASGYATAAAASAGVATTKAGEAEASATSASGFATAAAGSAAAAAASKDEVDAIITPISEEIVAVAAIAAQIIVVAALEAAVQTVAGDLSGDDTIGNVSANMATIADAAGPLTVIQTTLLQMATAYTNSQTRYIEAVAFA